MKIIGDTMGPDRGYDIPILFPTPSFFCLTQPNEGKSKNLRRYELGPKIIFSASAFCAEKHISEIHAEAKTENLQVYWFDLMQEAHLLVNSDGVVRMNPANDVNRGKEKDVVTKEQNDLVRQFDEVKRIPLHKRIKDKVGEGATKVKIVKFELINNKETDIAKIESEEACVTRLQGKYISIPFTDHTINDIITQVDLIVAAFTTLKIAEGRFHFHCHAGRGRAAVLMLLFNIYKEAKMKSFDQIISKFQNHPNKGKLENEAKKLAAYGNFFKAFYAYCIDKELSFTPWEKWAKNEGVWEGCFIKNKIPKK